MQCFCLQYTKAFEHTSEKKKQQNNKPAAERKMICLK